MLNDSSSNQSQHELAPAKGVIPWGPASAIVLTIVAFVGAQVVSVFVLMGLLSVFHWDRGVADWFSTITGQFAFVLVSDAIIGAAVVLFIRHRRGNLRQLGFKQPSWNDFGYALFGYTVYFVLLLLVLSALNAATPLDMGQKQELGFDNLINASERIMGLVSLVILPPIVEEIVFRGFLFTGLRKKMTFAGATIVTSLLFAMPHLLATSQGLLWAAGVDTLILSLVLCYLREKTGGLWAPMMVHAIKNSFAFVLLLHGFAVL